MVFIDRINRSRQPDAGHLGQIEATNPCGEQRLLPCDACNLGSINLARFAMHRRRRRVDWDELERVVRLPCASSTT